MWWPWRWPVDDRSSRSVGAKIVAFPAGARADRAEAQSGHIDAMQEVLVAIDTAIKEAEWSPDHQDQLVVSDEQAFRKRFGFAVNRTQRRQIIELKHDADLTDMEVRALKTSASLVFRDGALKVMAPTPMAVWGYIQILLLGLLMFLTILGVVSASRLNWKLVVGAILINALLLFAMKLSNETFIWPERIRKRMQQHQNAKLR